MAELGALSLRLQVEGEGAVTGALARVDAQAKRVGVTTEQAAAALTKLGISAKAAGGQIIVADSAVKSATSIVRAMGSSAVVTSQELATLAAAETQAGVAATAQGAATATAATKVTTLGTSARKTGADITAFGRQGRSAALGLGFAISQMASTGEASLLSLARQVSTITALLGGKLGVAGLVGAVGIGIFDFIRARAKVQGEIARDTAVQGARDAATIQKAQLQQDEAAQRLAFDRGLVSLRQFYDGRQEIIQRGIDAELTAKRREAAALSQPIAGESKKETADRAIAQRKLIAEITALERQGLAAQIALQGERENAERQLAETVLGFESQRMEAQGDSHEARLAQIKVEADAFRRALGPAPDTEERVKKFTDAMTAQADLARAQVDIDRLQTDLDTQRLTVQNELRAGKIDEMEASKTIADIERSSLPTLQQMVQRALEFAAALGDEGAVAALKKVKVELDGLGVDIAGVAKLKSQAESLGQVIRSGLESGIARGFAQGGIRGAFKGLLSEISSGFGSIAIRAGLDALKIGALMKPLAAALASLNPFVAIAAGIALVALGTSMGGSGGGGAGGSVGSTASAATPISIRRLIVDPNAGARQRIASGVGNLSAAPSAGHPLDGVALLAVDKPAGAQYLAARVDSYNGRRS